MTDRRRRPAPAVLVAAMVLGLAAVFAVLALARPVDHDESQYVAAAVLSARGLLPYRDYAYFQTPLQPLLFAPVALLAGVWTWPALRLLNALLGTAAVAFTAAAARAGGASRRAALATAALFASSDILLFGIGTARNDALPAACLSAALWLAMRAERGAATRLAAVAAGGLFAAAAAAKISYVLPAAVYAGWALWHARHRPVLVAAGALPVLVLVAVVAALAPEGFRFGTFGFPALAPAEYYAGTARAWKLGLAAKLFDTVKFLALGPPLLALGITMRPRRPSLPALLTAAGLVAALLPSPVWRQYLLPVLPPLFVGLALRWTERAPGRAVRIAAVIFAMVGLAPSIAAVAGGGGLAGAVADGRAIGRAMDAAGVPRGGPVATLSPQFLPGAGRLPDARFATGPFYFRSRSLLTPAAERRLHLISQARLPAVPAAILVGGEDRRTSGDPALDAAMERWAVSGGLIRRDVPGGRFRLYIRPRRGPRSSGRNGPSA